ncbi:amino acid permease [Staphylococcus epidermidis]|jgi:D-serine/D-alanine/glycine transporter|uniref:Amino acid permease n=5 Tax=Staphylococcus TaxID=1279 RepID=A0A4Q9W7S1_STAEP|nr:MULTISPECIES: amino acid permease [Staphylococcus]EHQ80144.1 amino acid permease [Staphylococcus epidermidis VCU057]EON81303.1 amino acid ABC transporter-like protein [Staphylococcus epidermidis 41tr]EON81331.1 amino acid ABC transporter-like protein [Staphylococcus epidermidis 528m]EON86745.1 amino acid ABC transporter-like protein [Staphylococcus epidermidis 36-1]ETJ13898.1 MAG: APC family amino acid-polyamine-organocation transporter [Staphylococcus sp. DORA_6_22]MDU7185301.1 amino acid
MAKQLQRELNNRHIQLIAIGGAIGTGLFLGSGQTISLTGPSLLFTYMLIGIVLFAFMRALGELLLSNSKFNSFVDIANEYLGPFGGFVIGWTYWVCWIVSSMSDLTAMGQYFAYWYPQVPHWLTVLFIVLLLISFNLLGARLFGELEFWFSIIKVVTIITMVIVGLVLIFLSFKTEYGHASFGNLIHHGGMFPHGAAGFLMSFQIAVYSFIGIELIGVTAGETKNPEKTIPKAINNVPIRILLFYIGGLLVIMSVIPWFKVDPDSSPFVKLFTLIGVPFAAGIVNFVVLTAAASATNSGIYSNSRILFGLAKQGLGPKVLTKTNSNGVPYLSMLVSSITLLIAALLNFIFPDAIKLFIYVTTLSTVLFLVVWGMIIVSYIAYVKKNPEQHQSSAFKLWGGKIIAYIVLSFFIFIFILLFFSKDTRVAIFISPLWFIFLFFYYKKYKNNAESLADRQRH